MSFWKSLPPGKIALMSLPDVCQLLESYDRQLFKVLWTRLLVVIMLLCVSVFLVVLPDEKVQLFLVCCAMGFSLVSQVLFWLLLRQHSLDFERNQWNL